jgi:3-oxoacyl-(acyl-carrier-protein) synthase
MMQKKITILGGELLSALGTYEQRIRHLEESTNNVASKSFTANGAGQSFPYYLIDDKARETSKEMVMGYLEEAVEALLKKVDLGAEALKRTALFLGCSSIDMSVAYPLEKSLEAGFEKTLPCQRVGNGYYADALQNRFGLRGLAFTYNTACTSSANALMDAAAMLESGMIDHALVVGIELSAETTIEGFASMQLLSPDAIRPFDKNRSGIVLGEAVSAVMLSRDDVTPSSWHYLGGMSNCETYSVTGANPNGEEISIVMRRALENAGVQREAIDAVKAHGTASALNDTAEINAMHAVFEKLPPFLSFKPYIGHTLGGCGTAELLLMMESVDAGFIPASLNFTEGDEALDALPLQQKLPLESGTFLMNFFGFGGNNTSYVVKKVVP